MTDYAKALGARLRAIRTQQGLSLHGVEEKSQGRWKAVVVGSYERGDRAVVISTEPAMVDARRIYDRNGFVPVAERNWVPVPGVELTAMVRELV